MIPNLSIAGKIRAIHGKNVFPQNFVYLSIVTIMNKR